MKIDSKKFFNQYAGSKKMFCVGNYFHHAKKNSYFFSFSRCQDGPSQVVQFLFLLQTKSFLVMSWEKLEECCQSCFQIDGTPFNQNTVLTSKVGPKPQNFSIDPSTFCIQNWDINIAQNGFKIPSGFPRQ